ncbi:MAG: sigma-70 family RNA polymerase sigma factor [Planctomycetota bacterium]|nr:sigma-70 family RNA polymerase sigma factor [Planctomycetota bacterium]
MNDEGRLIAQTLDGDASAFDQLVRRYQDRLFTSFVHVTGCHAEAEDVVQEAFIQAYLNLSQFRGQSGFYTWLYRIAFNRAMTRKRQTRSTVSTDQVETASLLGRAGQSETPGQRLEQLELADQIATALGRISEEHRAILILREIEGFDYQAIADMLQISLGTVRSRLSRARAILRHHLPDPRL